MVASRRDFEAGPIITSLDSDGIEVFHLSRERLEARVGEFYIKVLTAKAPHQPWRDDLHDIVMAARRSYWEAWGKVPLEDDLDEVSYVDVAWVSYSDAEPSAAGAAKRGRVIEGLTMRTVVIECEFTVGEERLPDDLRFWSGPGSTPLFDLLASKLYGDDKQLARKNIVVASRLSGFRAPGRSHNRYTPEAFSAIQVVAAARAIEDGVQYFVNTMREDMTAAVLSLNDGSHYRHVRTEKLLGLEMDAIRLNRADPFVFDHMCNYPGYFSDTADFERLVQRLVENGEAGLTAERLRATGIDSRRLTSLKPSQLKAFSAFLSPNGSTPNDSPHNVLRGLVRREVGDGPRSFAMSSRERLDEGVRLLKLSPSRRVT